MSEFVSMSTAAEFAREFIRAAIQVLPSKTLLHGRWISSFMSISQDITIPLGATFQAVTLSAQLPHDVKLLVHGYIRKCDNSWDFGSFSFHVTNRMRWNVKGELDKLGNFKFNDAVAIYSPHN